MQHKTVELYTRLERNNRELKIVIDRLKSAVEDNNVSMIEELRLEHATLADQKFDLGIQAYQLKPGHSADPMGELIALLGLMGRDKKY